MSFDINAFVKLEEETAQRSASQTGPPHDAGEPVINIEPPQEEPPPLHGDEAFPIYNASGLPLQEPPTFSESSYLGQPLPPLSSGNPAAAASAVSVGSGPASPLHTSSSHGSPNPSVFGSPYDHETHTPSIVGSPIPFPSADSPFVGPADPLEVPLEGFYEQLESSDARQPLQAPLQDHMQSSQQYQPQYQPPGSPGNPQASPTNPEYNKLGHGDSHTHNHNHIHPINQLYTHTHGQPLHHWQGPNLSLDDLLGVPQPNPSRHRALSDPWAPTFDGINQSMGMLTPRTTSGASSASLSPEHSPQFGAGRTASPSTRVGSAGLSVPQTRPRSHSSPYEYFDDPATKTMLPGSLAGSRESAGVSGSSGSNGNRKNQKHPLLFSCELCSKKFTRAYNLRSHMRTHTDERPFACRICGKSFARQHDRKRHEELHSGEKKFVCHGSNPGWGCKRRFARADALGRHFRTEAGKNCLRPLVETVRANGSNIQTAPEGILYYGVVDNEPQLTLLEGNPGDQSRRTVLMTAVSEQLIASGIMAP